MKILALDTSTKFLCLGLYDGGKISEYNLEVERKLSSLLAITIERVLDNLGFCVRDIDYFACGLGPGSFTGLRTGVAAIKGLSWALKKPVIGVPTLDTLANEVKDEGADIVPLVDAKRGLIYCSVFRKNKGNLFRKKPYMLVSINELIKIIKPGSVILGDGLNLYREKLSKGALGVRFLDKDYWYPKPHSILKLAMEMIGDKKITDAFSVEPLYLYPKECQIKQSKT